MVSSILITHLRNRLKGCEEVPDVAETELLIRWYMDLRRRFIAIFCNKEFLESPVYVNLLFYDFMPSAAYHVAFQKHVYEQDGEANQPFSRLRPETFSRF